MKYLISSNINYFKKTYPYIIGGLINSGILSSDIYMIVGGSGNYLEYNNIYNINLIPVQYNSFDLTALIYASEHVESDYYFLLHDTCLVGAKFKDLSQSFDPCLIKTLQDVISMNIGLYSKQSILDNFEYLQSIKFYPNSDEELQQCKRFFVEVEDVIFKKYENLCYRNSYTQHSDSIILNTLDELKQHLNLNLYDDMITMLQKSNIQRTIGYAPKLDLYKLQANSAWGDKWKIEV